MTILEMKNEYAYPLKPETEPLSVSFVTCDFNFEFEDLGSSQILLVLSSEVFLPDSTKFDEIQDFQFRLNVC
jgi:hypothetical protein